MTARRRPPILCLVVAGLLLSGCATPRVEQASASDRCLAHARKQLAMMGTPVDIYVFEAKTEAGRTVVTVSPPRTKDPQKDPIYFGGGGEFVCDAAGAVVSERYDR